MGKGLDPSMQCMYEYKQRAGILVMHGRTVKDTRISKGCRRFKSSYGSLKDVLYSANCQHPYIQNIIG